MRKNEKQRLTQAKLNSAIPEEKNKNVTNKLSDPEISASELEVLAAFGLSIDDFDDPKRYSKTQTKNNL
jgi:hypothetical protein